jgi:serine/threonine protein kinase
MQLSVGNKLGPFEILAPIGAGGMGEVYKARDTRLERTVAIKVAAAKFSERFEREARAVAALNHPNICTLHDLGPDYLVMEYVEGQPLRGALPVEKAVEYARQILDALDAAHREGIVHRDLKPANILVTKNGVKLLDFGLAKAERAKATSAREETVTQAITQEGAILGTLQYMAPEQLQGKPVDARSDLFSFGCVLYEMLTGKRAFEGESAPSVIAAVLERPAPSIAGVAPALDRVFQRCLVKDPDDRWQTARDLKSELEWVGSGSALMPAAPASKKLYRERAPWLAMGILLGVSLAGGAVFFAAHPSQPPHAIYPLRLTIDPPEKTIFSSTMAGSFPVPQFALSPDSRTIAFIASAPGTRPILWLRPMGEVIAHSLTGTENAEYPFWSPDSRWVAFFAQGKLKKIPIGGGPVQLVAEGFPDSRGGSWGPDGTILCSTGTGAIYSVPWTGGSVKPVTRLDPSRQEGSHRFPHFFPDGRHFLFTIRSGLSERRGVYAGSLDGTTKKLLVPFDSRAIYAPPGYLLFMDGDTLLGQSFDANNLEVSGQPFAVAERVGHAGTGFGSFSASGTDTLAHAGALLHPGRLIWFDRKGNPLGSVGSEGEYGVFRLSPDGKRLAVSQLDSGGTGDIWLTDFARGAASRFTFGPGLNLGPIWSPDGSRIVFQTGRKGLSEFYEKSSAGGGTERAVLLEHGERAAHLESLTVIGSDWSPDGQNLLFSAFAASGFDTWLLPLAGDSKPTKLLGSPSDEIHANFSPDGRFIAYSSNESGRFDVFVQTFPLSEPKWQISTEGGYEPRWRGDGHEIYYLSQDRKLMAVTVGTGPSFSVPEPLFQTRVAEGVSPQRTHYVPARDGERFLVNTQSGDPASAHIIIVLNWTAGLSK